MNKLLTSALLLCAMHAAAQTPFNTRDSLNINEINAMTLVHGDVWWDPTASEPHCFYPNGSTKSVSSTGALWMAGYDAGNQLHVAAQTYRIHGNDYWPGPLNASDTLTYDSSQKWANIWKVNRTDIQYFQALTTKDSATVPAAIWTWPAKGNTHAAGNGGAALIISTDMAPFVDVNMDGSYQPEMGDYPDIKGDQALWWVFSDNGPTHNESNGKPLAVEVHAMAYAYHRGTAIDRVVYYEYNVLNKSANNYNNFRIGQMSDVDLGNFADDYIGFDSSRAMGYVYNGGASDLQYGDSIPMAGVMMLQATIGATSIGCGSFTYYNNDNTLIGNPTVDTEFNNYLRSKIKGGQHITNDMTSPGMTSRGYGPGPEVNYVFSGVLGPVTEWTECAAANIPGDRRFVMASKDVTFNAGDKITLVMALAVTLPDTTHACGDTLLGVTDLTSTADTAIRVHDGPLPPLTGVNNVDNSVLLSLYPNPAHTVLNIDNDQHNLNAADITVYNAMGRHMNVPITANGNKVAADISGLPVGVYIVQCRNNNGTGNARFIKE